MTGKIMPLRERDTSTVQAAADAFLSSPRYANLNTRRSYTSVLDRCCSASATPPSTSTCPSARTNPASGGPAMRAGVGA